ncbi:kinase-like protein [Annulohypoxylon moriforme]|nr:kinase-like protein [Annulohypoxylon moriforme]
MKPENILWFKGLSDNGQFENDVLKISDFGLTRWHRNMSNDKTDIHKLAVSRSYRAPEYDLWGPISQSWDIWSLACLYLEFITWYLWGWDEGVDEFSKDRTKENSSMIREGTYAISEDDFFNLIMKNGPNIGSSTKYEASLKRSVISWINKLHATDGCSRFIHDFLDLISDKMLRIGSEKRTKCKDITDALDELYNKCEDRVYCSESDQSLSSREPSSSKPHLDSYHSLDNLLRDWLNKHRDGKHNDFLTKRVRKHLQDYFENARKGGYNPHRASADHYLQFICSHDQFIHTSTPVGSIGQETYIRLFATLILVNKGADIFKFIDNGIRDKVLPINILDEKLQRCITHWTDRRYRDDFDMWQWRMNVPFLSYGQHETFDAQVILPFIKPGGNGSHSSHSGVEAHNYFMTEAGGYGEVKCVEIHPECHNFHRGFASLRRREGPFALKKLLEHDPIKIGKVFQKEVEMLKKFDGNVHPHIVTVLATFKHGDSYYLLFPWADGDLGKYLENNPTPDYSLKKVRWLSNQCLKIIEAVHLVHFPPEVDNLQPGDRRFGRHGDIKAENILVFRSREREPDEPDLVLSDFGLGSVHREISKSNVPKEKVAVTPDFRPPECDMEGGKISRAYDVWTLGCLFLDLLTWLLGGEDLRQQFDDTRMTPYIDGRETRIYFEIVVTEHGKHGYIIKDQVKKWFDKLHGHNQCAQFVHEFLILIENEMLIVETNEKKRARTDVLLKELQGFADKCRQDDRYCLRGIPTTRDPTANLIAEGPLNDATKKKLRFPLRTVGGRTQQAEPAQDGAE